MKDSRLRKDFMSIKSPNHGHADSIEHIALTAFRELRARIELNANGEAVSLDLLDSPIVDEHLQKLNALTKLERVYLGGLTRITDAGLRYLKDLMCLKELDISGSVAKPNRRRITDAGMEHLKGLVSLEKLSLRQTQITDAGLACLVGLRNLTMLDLRNTLVSDHAVEYLGNFKKLTLLDLTNTKASEDGVTKLRHAMPDCEIRRSQQDH